MIFICSSKKITKEIDDCIFLLMENDRQLWNELCMVGTEGRHISHKPDMREAPE